MLEQLVLTSQKADVEFQINTLTGRLQTMTYKSGSLMEDYLSKMQQKTDETETNDAEENIETFNSDEFMLEYEIATTKLNAQEKVIELQKNNLETKQKALSTQLESTEKRIQKNTEKEFNTSMG